MSTIRIHRGWKAQDLMTREDLVQILSSNLKVSQHPVPEGMAGALFTVDGVAACCDAIMDLLETRARARVVEEDKTA